MLFNDISRYFEANFELLLLLFLRVAYLSVLFFTLFPTIPLPHLTKPNLIIYNYLKPDFQHRESLGLGPIMYLERFQAEA